jgi:hypothetical protein
MIQSTVVVKQYPSSSIPDYYHEVHLCKLMRQLQRHTQEDGAPRELVSRYLVKYHGAFQLCGKGYIILEDADESLEDMYQMRRNRAYEWGIHDREQLLEVWEAMAPLFRALETGGARRTCWRASGYRSR